MKNMYIWSNFNTNIIKDDFQDNCVHVFINVCNPFIKNINIFKKYPLYFFGRRIGNTNNYHGKNILNKYSTMFIEKYIISDKKYDYIEKLDISNDLKNSTKIHLNNLNQNMNDNPTCGRTTGFVAYQACKQIFQQYNIILVNFNRKINNQYDRKDYEDWHNIDIEESYYKINNIENIYIG